MNRLYVAGQNVETREWIPVAELKEVQDGYELRYTRGAQRLPGFGGLSRMQALDNVYYSRTLFPFFSNRLIPKSRPEYKDYLRWVGLDASPIRPLEMLAVTGGVRATDNYEIVAPPEIAGKALELNFFPRGLRYLPSAAILQLMAQADGNPLFLMRDLQNNKDPKALAIRTERPHAMLVGYVPRYYCLGLCRLLESADVNVEASVRRVNTDAPLDMKLLVSIRAMVPTGFDLLNDVEDFLYLTSDQVRTQSTDILNRMDLNI